MELRAKVVEFPASRDQRLEEALRLYDGRQFPEALDRFIALIDGGCDEAYYYVGCIYEEGGHGVKQDLEKAFFYYQKSVDVFGYVEGYLALGRLHYFGIGVDQDYRKALEFFSLAGEKADNGIAQMMLGQMYYYGHGVQQSTGIAREYFQKAANQGYVFALSALAALEIKSGNRSKGLWLRIKAIWQAGRVTWKNPHDRRLRRS